MRIRMAFFNVQACPCIISIRQYFQRFLADYMTNEDVEE